jgi:hypothetical protein
MEVCPFLDIIPLMSDTELDDLAADIKQNGLHRPIILDDEGVILVDGRCRHIACERAGVEPRFERLEPKTDLRAYVVSANILRQNYTKGQRGMGFAIAREYDPTVLKFGVSEDEIATAAIILANRPDLAKLVIDGIMSLDKAYAETQTTIAEREREQEQMELLRINAPDLVNDVVEGMSVKDALVTFTQRSTTLDELASQIRAKHAAAEVAAKSTIMHAMDAGDLLLKAKQKINQHGMWLPYIIEQCRMSPRTAQVYMRLARAPFGDPGRIGETGHHPHGNVRCTSDRSGRTRTLR